MKKFIKKNKFFIVLLLFVIIAIVLLSAYMLQKSFDGRRSTDTSGEVEKPSKKEESTKITAFSGRYTRSVGNDMNGNVITVSWAYHEGTQKVRNVYLYLNNGEPINVTKNSYYDFLQSVYDFPTGVNTVRLKLQLENGKTIEQELNVSVDDIIYAKQSVVMDETTLKVTLEYMYDAARPVSPPSILITAIDSNIMPVVTYVGTQQSASNKRIIAQSTFNFSWNKIKDIPKTMNVRWKFNSTADSFDELVKKPPAPTPSG